MHRIGELESLLAQKERDIQKLVAEKKVYEKISRTQEKKLDDHHYEVQASAFRDEIRLLKQKVRELEEKEKQSEKTDQKKHEHYLKIEERYRELCQKFGVDPSGDPNKPTTNLHKQSAKSLGNGKIDPSGRGKRAPEDSEAIEVIIIEKHIC